MTRKQSRTLITRLNRDAEQIATQFGLAYRCVEAERANVKSRYGVCYSDGTIRIRLRHATSGKPLKYSSLVSTLCHELAHLRHFNHGLRFREFYRRILEWARSEGIYQPGNGAADSPLPTRDSARERDLGAGREITAAATPRNRPGGHPAGRPNDVHVGRVAVAEQLDLFG